MLSKIGLACAAVVALPGIAYAGFFPEGTPLPLAGVTGPVGLAIGAAGYGAYRLYRKYAGKNR